MAAGRDCVLAKPVSAFYRNGCLKDGFDSYCKPCRLERQRASRVGRGLTLKPYGPQRRTLDRDILCRPIGT
jgi:hypothetical protein